MPKYKNKSQKKPYSASRSRIHNDWYCQPCDVEVSKVVNSGQLTCSSTAQNSEVAIGQQIEALQSQLTGLMTKVNDHINVHF